MSASTITILRCDRCDFEAQFAAGDRLAGWGKVYATEEPVASEGRPRCIGVGQQADDLCPGCVAALFQYWVTADVVEQPTAPPPAAVTKPVYTLDHRRGAIELVTAAVKLRIDLAIAAVREQPTAILTGEIIEAAYVELGATAAGIVDGIADMLELRRMRK